MAEEVEEEKSSKMKFIIIGLLVLLLGGGAAYYFMFMGNGAAAEDAVAEPVVSSEEQAAANTGYLSIEQPFRVNFAPDKGVRLLQVSITIAFLEQDGMKAAILAHEPMIRNNFLMIMGKQLPQELQTSAGKQQLQVLLLDEMHAMMEKVGVKASIQNVFFTSFVMQ